MKNELKNYLLIAIIGALVLFSFAGLWYVRTYARSVPPTRTFSVTGEGKAIAVPDIAKISFGIRTEGDINLAALQEENTEKSNDVIAFLKDQKIAKEDIKTQAYNITPRYQYYPCKRPLAVNSEPCLPPEIVGYAINQTITIKLRNLDKVGIVLTGVVENGANTVSGPTFTIDDPDALKQEAREEAIKKARVKAKAVAKAARFRLGKPVSIQEGTTPIFTTRLAIAESLSFDGTVAKASTPSIEPGSQEVKVNVTITYEIK